MKHSHSGGLLGAQVTSEKVGGHKPRHVLRVHSLNPLTQRKASGAAGPGNRRPSRSPHHRECQFHCDSLGIGVMCAWFCGQVLAVGTIQARPAGVSGQKWGSFLPLTAPGAHQLYCTYTGSLAYRELGVEPTGSPGMCPLTVCGGRPVLLPQCGLVVVIMTAAPPGLSKQRPLSCWGCCCCRHPCEPLSWRAGGDSHTLSSAGSQAWTWLLRENLFIFSPLNKGG